MSDHKSEANLNRYSSCIAPSKICFICHIVEIFWSAAVFSRSKCWFYSQLCISDLYEILPDSHMYKTFTSKTNSWPSVTNWKMWRMFQTVLRRSFLGSDSGYKPSTFSSLCHKSSPVAIYGSVSLPPSHMGSIRTPASWVNGSVETDCRQAFAVDHWSRLIREISSWAAGSRERPVKGARCIINNEADCKEVSAKAGLSQTLVFNNWPLVMPQRRYTDLVTDVCVLESLKRMCKRVDFVPMMIQGVYLSQHNSLFQ